MQTNKENEEKFIETVYKIDVICINDNCHHKFLIWKI